MSTSTHVDNSRLLIVDDNPTIHEDFRKILVAKSDVIPDFAQAEAALFGDASAGSNNGNGNGHTCFHVESAFQGKEGFEMVKRALDERRQYATAFVDMRMPPGWDGVETTTRIWDVDPDLQIVICTAYSDCSWDEVLRKLGRSDRLVILKKPFDPIEVLQLANSLTRKWQLLQESKTKVADLEQIIVARTAQMMQEQEKFRTIFENSPDGIFQTTPDGHYLTANPALARIYGYGSPKELMEQLTDIRTQLYVDPARRQQFSELLEKDSVVREFESEIKCKDGSKKWISETACKVTRLDGSLLHYQGFVVDITAQHKAKKERDLMEAQLRQAQKLECVGHLAAGIAHEMNTPIQYIGNNIRFIEESFSSLSDLLRSYEKLARAVKSNTVTPEIMAAVETSSEKADIAYLQREIPLAVQQSLDGVVRVAHIVNAIKEFSHPGNKEKIKLDLNHAIGTTVTVARSEWKNVADLTTDFAPDLPQVPCLPAEFNQAILNLIVNAAHAIGDVIKDKEGSKGVIKISTRRDGAWAEVRISDTGTGIPDHVRDRVFEPFFTTKEIGKGTGQGLAIARSTIVDKHGGQISFESAVGRGTTFIVRLPTSAAKS